MIFFFSDAVKLVKDHAQERTSNMTVPSNCQFLFNSLADRGEVTAAREILQTLLDFKLVSPKAQIFAALVKTHLVK